ncbi:MAG: LPP20 family lipoprotein [Pseudomonadales bacterium]|nr:LPP20 family lipoprotein [Pseudomonadales bacterium]
MFQKIDKKLPGICLILLLLSGCSSQPERPQWINQPHDQYPDGMYLSAVGSADNQQAAGDRATANIAKVFEVSVQESSQDYSSSTVLTGQGQQQIENKQSLAREIKLETDKVLQGAKIVEYWQSDKKRYYALAVLAKQPAASGFTQAILKSDREVIELLEYARVKANNPLVALKALQKAASVQALRDENNRSLMIVNQGQGVKGNVDSAFIDKLIRDALASLQIQVDAENESVKAEIQQALSTLGVHIVEQSNLVFYGTLDLAPVSFKQGWYWQRGSYELIFKDGDTVLTKRRYPIKISAQESAMVEQRIRDELNQNLPQHLFELLSKNSR